MAVSRFLSIETEELQKASRVSRIAKKKKFWTKDTKYPFLEKIYGFN